MNYIQVLEPRWHDNTVLIAAWKVGSINQIVIDHHEHPTPYYMSGDQIKKYTKQAIVTKAGRLAPMYVVPLKDLSTDLILDTL